MNIDYEVIKELSKDFTEKKNKLKIEIDNIEAEIEILKKTIKHITEINDESKLFSPRNIDNDYVSLEEKNKELEIKENLYDEYFNEYEYYNNYSKRIKAFLKCMNDEEKKVSEKQNIKVEDNNKTNSELIDYKKINDSGYSLNLNYNIDEVRDKIINIKHKSDTCLKIYNNDRNRAKQEIINIKNSLDAVLKLL